MWRRDSVGTSFLRSSFILGYLFNLAFCSTTAVAQSKRDVLQTLTKATDFFIENCSKQGGYVWRYSYDLKLSEGEGETGPTRIWVQPPGTPAIGDALLDVYDVTKDRRYLDAAVKAAHALVRGQLQSGGWFYHIEFDPKLRREYGYRDNKEFKPSRRRKNKNNITTLDDDTTPSAIRFLARIDKMLDFKDAEIHDASRFALQALLDAQYPNGGWYQNWDNYPTPPNASDFPVIPASYPEKWSRKWLNDWPGRYYTNDNVAGAMIDTMLLAWRIYEDERYLQSAKSTGAFLLLAQMPDPQPAWAQQYDLQMHPCWDRKFEPPAISSWESQFMMEALIRLYRATGDKKYLEPIPKALAYLKKSRLKNGMLARFYELKTNRPLYFTQNTYELTYDDSNLPTHYGFVQESRLEQIEAEYRQLLRNKSAAPPLKKPQRTEVAKASSTLDSRGAWIDARSMSGFNKASKVGVIQSETFVYNISLLTDYLASGKD